MRSGKTIVFLDPNSVITSNQATFNRHVQYANEMKRYEKSVVNIIVLQRSEKIDSFSTMDDGPIEVYRLNTSKWNPFNLLIEYIKFIRLLQQNEPVFICGDPWKPVLQMFLIRFLGRQSYPFQVQIHFDIFDPKWKYASLRNLLKYLLALPVLYSANNLRFVSEHQVSSLASRLFLRTKKAFITPVPLNLDLTEFHDNDKPRPRTIGFLGRLSEDRGVEYLEFAAKAIRESDICMVIAGSGPAAEVLEEELSRILGNDRLLFPGFLEGPELVKFWESIGVLLSTAESESYGRTIRESLCYGVPVIALDSLGALQLKKGALGDFVHIFSKNEIQKIKKSDIEPCFLQELGSLGIVEEARIQKENKRKLYASWNDLYEK